MYQDREEAGQRLAAALSRYSDCSDGMILAIPRGGVVVGLQMRLVLHLRLDVLITRKLGAPDNPELAVGALSETGYLHPTYDRRTGYACSAGSVDPGRR